MSAVSSRSLVLVAVAGVLLAGCASSSDDAGSEVTAADVTGQWSEPDSEPLVYLELAEGGTVTGSDGCNQLTGGWELDGSTIDLGQLASTMMACEDVETWLSGASTATVSGDELTVLDDGGEEIGVLEKQG